MQRHWTCPQCNEKLLVTVVEKLQHEQKCSVDVEQSSHGIYLCYLFSVFFFLAKQRRFFSEVIRAPLIGILFPRLIYIILILVKFHDIVSFEISFTLKRSEFESTILKLM